MKKEFNDLWLDFRSENPNTVGAFMEQYKSFKWLYDKLKNQDVSDDGKITLTKEMILSTGDWYEGDYINQMEGYFWKHKSILNDGYTFYMRRYLNDGLTIITEEGREDNKLFEGYIKSMDNLKNIIDILHLEK